jgi:two-component system, chemotaxis family, sensor kinase CheA
MGNSQPETKNDLFDDLLGDFLDESDQLLTQLNSNLLQLDEWVQALDDDHHQRCDDDLLNEMFRSAHSLKGLSAMLGLTEINHLTHKIENVFDAARHDELSITRDVTELMFMGLDQLTAMIGLLKEPGGEPVDCDAVLEAIRRVLQTAGAERTQTTQADAERALDLGTGPQVDAGETGTTAPVEETGDSPHLPERPGGGHHACTVVAPMGTVPFVPQQADPLEGLQDEGNIPEKYLSMFVDEAEASLEGLAAALLALEGGGGDTLRNLLGIAHKIKGSAASVGLKRAAKLAHLMEDLLEDLVASGDPLSASITDILLKCTDGLQQHVSGLKCGNPASDQLGSLARSLLAAKSGSPADRSILVGEVTFQPGLPTAGLKAQLIYEKLTKLGDVRECQPAPETLDGIGHLDCFRFRLATDQSREAVAGQLRVGGVLAVSVEPLGEGPARAQEADSADSSQPAPVKVASDAAAAADPAPATAGTGPTAVKPRTIPAPVAPEPLPEAGQRAAATGQRPTETVRVDTDRLDQLMDLAGQLVINKAQFSQIGERLKAVADCNQAVRSLDKLSAELDRLGARGTLRIDGQHLTAELESVRTQVRRIRNDLEPLRREVQTLSRARDSVRELLEAIHQLDRVSDGIQKGVMEIRMVPIGPLFARFNRVVRDISRASGKQVRLVIAGEKTELDKRMIDELGDPLVHLVRNSADHGIEPPDQREAAGKPRQGTVTLDAFHRGNSIVIEVRDDGQGLDADRILRKAIDKGLVTEADAQRMTAPQIYQLIWRPGLSTAEKVTDVSGRGMGMDIVKTKIEELSGAVEISSERGKGTTITIKLPLTLAILPSLMVDIAGAVFAMPMETVTEIVSVRRDKVRSVRGRPMATVRGRVVSLVNLGDLVSFHRAGEAADTCQAPETTLVVVSDAGQEIGLAVDRVIGEEDVVIKSIAEHYKNVPGIAGASILGNGRVALILDVPALIATLSKRAALVTC